MSLFVKDSLNSTTLMCGSHDNSLLASPQPSEEEEKQKIDKTVGQQSILLDSEGFQRCCGMSRLSRALEQGGGDTSWQETCFQNPERPFWQKTGYHYVQLFIDDLPVKVGASSIFSMLRRWKIEESLKI